MLKVSTSKLLLDIAGLTGLRTVDVFRAFNATEQPLAKEAISYWTSFARNANPSVNRAESSPEWSAGPASRIVIQEGNSTVTTASVMEAVPEEYKARCAVSLGLLDILRSDVDAFSPFSSSG